jgi:hypothetical protein
MLNTANDFGSFLNEVKDAKNLQSDFRINKSGDGTRFKTHRNTTQVMKLDDLKTSALTGTYLPGIYNR